MVVMKDFLHILVRANSTIEIQIVQNEFRLFVSIVGVKKNMMWACNFYGGNMNWFKSVQYFWEGVVESIGFDLDFPNSQSVLTKLNRFEYCQSNFN